MPASATYSRRRNRLSRGEREWRVEEGALVSVGASGRERRWAWREIVSVRLYHEPARRRPWRYTFELHARDGAKILLDNAHYAGEGAFEERSDDYTAFVRAALDQLGRENPKVRIMTGETHKRFFFLILFALACLGAAAYALTVTPTPFDHYAFATPLKFGLVLAMLPLFWLLVARAMPRGASPDSVPDHALPPTRES